MTNYHNTDKIYKTPHVGALRKRSVDRGTKERTMFLLYDFKGIVTRSVLKEYYKARSTFCLVLHSLKFKVHVPKSEVRSPKSKVLSLKSEVQSPKSIAGIAKLFWECPRYYTDKF